MPYHDSGESRDRAKTGEACGVTGVQHEGNHPTNAGCHKSGVQSVTTREHQGSAVQDTCMERRGRKWMIGIEGNLSAVILKYIQDQSVGSRGVAADCNHITSPCPS